MNATIRNTSVFQPYDYAHSKNFWECIYHDKNYNGYIFFCIKSKEQFKPLYHCKTDEIPSFLSSLQINPNLDYYYTPNHFRVNKSGVKRDSNHLFAYTCCVIDIDCHNKKIPYEQLKRSLQTYINKLDTLIHYEEYTPYNIIVKTGRGLQIIYVYENALSYKVEFKHKQVCDILLKQHQKVLNDFPELSLTLDKGTTRRLSGVYRLPSSYNPQSQQTHLVQYTISDYPFLDVDRTLDTYDTFSEIPTYEIQKDFQAVNKPNIARCKKVINAVYCYQNDGRANQNKEGHENRTCSCFVLAPFLLALYNYSTALEILLNFNNNFLQPLPPKRIEQILMYCLENYTNDEKCSMKYFKNSTILDYLGIDSGDYDIYVTDNYVYNPYFANLSQEERLARKEAKTKRNDTIKTLIEQGKSFPEIAKETHTNLSTIYRCAKRNALTPPKEEKPWEALGISKSTYYRRKKK